MFRPFEMPQRGIRTMLLFQRELQRRPGQQAGGVNINTVAIAAPHP